MTHDGGSAPNPYGGICTLAICKPRIRSSATVGDWVAATAGATAPWKDGKHRLIYAMKVTEKLSMKDYDERCNAQHREKIPRRPARVFEEFVGDSIYDHSKSNGRPILRPSVHLESNADRDLGGKFVLMSREFCYFGANAPVLPDSLLSVAKIGQAHQSNKNAPFVDHFVEWVQQFLSRKIHGEPIHKSLDWLAKQNSGSCSAQHLAETDDHEDHS